jgi:hemerythrin
MEPYRDEGAQERPLTSPPALSENLQPMTWMDILETGIPEIDADHRGFIDQYETLRLMAVTPLTKVTVCDALQRMLEHSRQHFEREEAVLLRCKFPRYRAHSHAHRQFVTRFEELVERATGADQQGLECFDILGSLRDLLVDLLFRHDLDYKSHIQYSLGR